MFALAKTLFRNCDLCFASASQISCPIFCRFAIYIPLFLPMSLPLLISLFAAVKWLRNKSKKEEKHQSGSMQSDTGQYSWVSLCKYKINLSGGQPQLY